MSDPSESLATTSVACSAGATSGARVGAEAENLSTTWSAVEDSAPARSTTIATVAVAASAPPVTTRTRARRLERTRRVRLEACGSSFSPLAHGRYPAKDSPKAEVIGTLEPARDDQGQTKGQQGPLQEEARNDRAGSRAGAARQ